MKTRPMSITLIQMISFCYEKDEIFNGWGTRWRPFPSEAEASTTYEAWLAELTHWRGPPRSTRAGENEQSVEWPDIRMKRAGRGIVLWIRPGDVWDMWYSDDLWKNDPCGRAFEWEGDDDDDDV